MRGFMRGFMRGLDNQIITHVVRTLVHVRTKRYSCCYWSSGSVNVAETIDGHWKAVSLLSS